MFDKKLRETFVFTKPVGYKRLETVRNTTELTLIKTKENPTRG